MASFCSTCGAPLADEARFCAKCGTPVQTTSAEPATEFVIPLPSDSPYRVLVWGKGDELLTNQQLWNLGVQRPELADRMLHKGMTHIWRYYEGMVRSRLAELEAEGWELTEPFEPKVDFYGVMTTSSIKERIRFEQSRVSGSFGSSKEAISIHGFVLKMRRPTGHTQEETSA